jgi:hypothetical protein
MTKTTARSRAEMRRLDDMPSQLAALETMNVPALAEKYRELYGEPTRSRNRAYLKKRLAWRIERTSRATSRRAPSRASSSSATSSLSAGRCASGSPRVNLPQRATPRRSSTRR